MSDLLRMDYINSLPQPFTAIFWGGDEWPVHDIEVGTSLIRIDVGNKFQVMEIADVMYFTDADGGGHEVETFYVDYVA